MKKIMASLVNLYWLNRPLAIFTFILIHISISVFAQVDQMPPVTSPPPAKKASPSSETRQLTDTYIIEQETDSVVTDGATAPSNIISPVPATSPPPIPSQPFDPSTTGARAPPSPAPAKPVQVVTVPANAPPPPPVQKLRRVYAVFDTNMGSFKAKLFHTHAPKTVENFIALAEGRKAWKDPKSGDLRAAPIYVNMPFHRVRKNFIIQTGDPYLDGRADVGFYINDEFHPDLKYTKPGLLAMANLYPQPNTNSTQFFITLKELYPPNSLENKNTIFGEIIEGMDVVQKISEVPTNRMTDRPLKDVIIKSIKIIKE